MSDFPSPIALLERALSAKHGISIGPAESAVLLDLRRRLYAVKANEPRFRELTITTAPDATKLWIIKRRE
jgi:hypothetical protein